MRSINVFIFISAIALLFLFIHISNNNIEINYIYNLKDYYLNNAIQFTKANNIVTAIYLNYRFYDTIFESLMLLIALIAIIHMSIHD